MKTALYLAAIVALLAVGGSALWVAHSVSVARADLQETEYRATDSLKHAATTLTDVAAILEEEREDLAVTQATIANVLNKRTGEVTAQTKTVSESLKKLIATSDKTVSGVRADLSPVLSGAMSTERELSQTLNAMRAATIDAQNIADDLYPDLKAAVESATVASTSAAQVSQEVRRVAPDVATDAQKTVKNVRRMTSWPMVLGKAILSLPAKLVHLF